MGSRFQWQCWIADEDILWYVNASWQWQRQIWTGAPYFTWNIVMGYVDMECWVCLESAIQGPVYCDGLPIIPAWISNHMSKIFWDEITYPFPNFNGCTIALKLQKFYLCHCYYCIAQLTAYNSAKFRKISNLDLLHHHESSKSTLMWTFSMGSQFHFVWQDHYPTT